MIHSWFITICLDHLILVRCVSNIYDSLKLEDLGKVELHKCREDRDSGSSFYCLYLTTIWHQKVRVTMFERSFCQGGDCWIWRTWPKSGAERYIGSSIILFGKFFCQYTDCWIWCQTFCWIWLQTFVSFVFELLIGFGFKFLIIFEFKFSACIYTVSMAVYIVWKKSKRCRVMLVVVLSPLDH